MFNTSAAPAVDRLVVVADNERNAFLRRGKQSQPGVLDCVGVLEFVDEQVPEAPPVMREYLGIVTPQFVRPQQQLRKIDEAAALAELFVGGIQRDHLATVRVRARRRGASNAGPRLFAR